METATTLPTAHPKARVLFVDDEPRVLTTMRMLFRGRYDMHFAEGGPQALEFLKTSPVDVIVSDQRMPGMTGIELLRAARELNPHAMRILLTGYSDLNAIIGSINEGEIFRFVNKPWNNEDLITTVSRAVTAAKASHAAASRDLPQVPTNGDAPGVLVLDDDPGIPQKIQAILGAEVRVVGATSMVDAVNQLENGNIGVVVSDTRVQDHPVIGLLNTLKEHHPELVTVILTERADAGQCIELINQGQIYRFVTKPIHDSQCKIAVNSAVKHHHRLAHSPELHQRYEVEKTAPPPSSSPAASLVDRIRSFRSLVRRFV